VKLLAQPGADPESEEDWKRNGEDNQARREAYVEIGVSVIHGVVAEDVPHHQSEDRDGRGSEKREERGCKREQKTLEQAEALERKTEDSAAGVALAKRGLH
jgi:hypothetical protein